MQRTPFVVCVFSQIHCTTLGSLFLFLSVTYVLYRNKEHFDEPIRIVDMAKIAYMSPSSFSRAFKDVSGLTFKDFLVKTRLREAVPRMEIGSSISRIALECGFGSIRSYNRLFREHFGMPPHAYRQRL